MLDATTHPSSPMEDVADVISIKVCDSIAARNAFVDVLGSRLSMLAVKRPLHLSCALIK
jgi:hypothetical protein